MSLYRAYFVPNGVDPTGLLCVHVGPAKYFDCGDIIWAAQYHLDKPAERQGGWLVQRIESDYAVWNCEMASFIGSAKCGEFSTRDPEKQETLVYWELVDMRNSAPFFNSPRDIWGVQSSQFVGPKSFGQFVQNGFAWFHAGQNRPAANWMRYPNSPSRGALLSCEPPAGQPDFADFPVYRRLEAYWDCCDGQSLGEQVCPNGPVIEPPNGGTPYVLLDTEVRGQCP